MIVTFRRLSDDGDFTGNTIKRLFERARIRYVTLRWILEREITKVGGGQKQLRIVSNGRIRLIISGIEPSISAIIR
jgi:hypothetical protein